MYLPVSKVSRGEKARVLSSVDMRSCDIATLEQLTIQLITMSIGVSTDGLLEYWHIKLRGVPAIRLVPLARRVGCRTGTGEHTELCMNISSKDLTLTLYSDVCGGTASANKGDTTCIFSSLRCCYLADREFTGHHSSTCHCVISSIPTIIWFLPEHV